MERPLSTKDISLEVAAEAEEEAVVAHANSTKMELARKATHKKAEFSTTARITRSTIVVVLIPTSQDLSTIPAPNPIHTTRISSPI